MNRLDEIEARANAATEGPWEWDPQDGWLGTEDEVTVGWKWGTLTQEGDGQFIAHARTDVPALVAALRAVIDLHRTIRTSGAGGNVYEVCQTCNQTAPCAYVRTIHRHLGDDL